jgi:DNA polymerase
MGIVTIDFETYYDKDYSLKKMTTEAYIRDPRFEVIGVGIKIDDGQTDWYSGDRVGQFLNSIDYTDKAILCHHTAFDGAILSWHYNIKPKLWLDTLSMARPKHSLTVGGSLAALATHYKLNAKGTEVENALGKRRADFDLASLNRYAEYCCNDVDITYALFNKLKVDFPVSELLIIDRTLRMYTEPRIVLDEGLLSTHLANVIARKEALLDSIHVGKDELMSNNKFAAVLRSLGVEPPMKTSLRTGKETYAFGKTDKGMEELQDHPDEKVQSVVAARLGVKSTLEETRTQSLIGVSKRGKLPILLNYYGAHTGRFSGGDGMNLQNLPSRGDNTIRRAIRAEEGHVLISCDSSQIEARTVAWLAGQNDLVQAFAEGRDVYSEFASEVYGRKITKSDKVERFVGKTCILGLGYGMGAEKFRRTLEIGQAGVNVIVTLEEAQRIVQLYRTKNHKIVSLWALMNHAIKCIANRQSGLIAKNVSYDEEGIRLPNGFYIRYPALRLNNENSFVYIADPRQYRKMLKERVLNGVADDTISWTKIYGGKATENVVQALARIVVGEQMIVVGQKYPVLFQVHDELIISAPAADADNAQQYVEKCMSMCPKWAPDLPVACESGMADNYGDT